MNTEVERQLSHGIYLSKSGGFLVRNHGSDELMPVASLGELERIGMGKEVMNEVRKNLDGAQAKPSQETEGPLREEDITKVGIVKFVEAMNDDITGLVKQMNRIIEQLEDRAAKKLQKALGEECHIEAALDGDRELVVKWIFDSKKLGEPVVKETRVQVPIMIDKGVWNENGLYSPGDVVSHQGSGWIAQRTLTGSSRPGEGSGWRLFVKAGRNGRDAQVSV